MKATRITMRNIVFLAAVIVAFLVSVTVVQAQSLGYDLNITSAQIIQVVNNPRMIVANKPAAIKVTIMSDFPEPVKVPIEVKYNFGNSTYVELGPDSTGVTLQPGNNIFYIPGGPWHFSDDGPWIDGPPYLYWVTSGLDDDIEVNVDPDQTVYEFNIRNNIEIIEKEVMRPIDFDVLIAPVRLGGDYFDIGVSADALEDQRAIMLKTYPLASLTFVQQPMVRRDDVESFIIDTAYDDFVFDLSTEAKLLGYNRVGIVLSGTQFRGGLAIQMLSDPVDRLPVVLGNSSIINLESLIAHEIGHTFYLWHPFSDWFNDLPAIQDYKYSVTERDYGDLYNTLMSYETESHWIDKNRYCDYPKTWFVTPPEYPYTVAGTWQWNLQDQFKKRLPLPVWLIKAKLYKTGILDVLPWYKTVGLADLLPKKNFPADSASVSAVAVQNPDGKRSLQIVLLDNNQQQLAVFPFNVSFRNLMEPDPEGELIVVEHDVVPFHFNIPVTANTALIQIVDEIGTVLGQRAVTPHAPEVQLQNPNGGEIIPIGSMYSMCWSGIDQDGDTLQYFLAVSPDGGYNWLPISSDEEGPCLMWDTTNYAPGPNYLVKVIATDGINTGEDISDSTFSLVVPDDDGDGVSNDVDNCPKISNPEQEDMDADDIGDVCDDCIDSDGDGYGDPEALNNVCPTDICQGSDTGSTVMIDGCDSGVENQPLGEGCKMSDFIAQCAQSEGNHGTFVSCVAHLTNPWKEEGRISGEDKGLLQDCAARSLYGKITIAAPEKVTIALSKLSCGLWQLYATTSADTGGIYSFCNVPE